MLNQSEPKTLEMVVPERLQGHDLYICICTVYGGMCDGCVFCRNAETVDCPSESLKFIFPNARYRRIEGVSADLVLIRDLNVFNSE
jgi:hypothetical protein